MIFRILLDPQGGEGNGAGEAAPTGNDKGGDKAPDLVKAVESLITRHGDPTAALRVLMGENYDLRDKNREIGKRLPPDGSIVLSGDDAKRWGTYRELGDPSDLRKGLGERDTYKTEADGFRRAKFLGEVAELHKYEPTVLATLAEKLEIVIAEEKGKDGKAVQVARVKGEGDESTPLTEYAEKHWAKFLPSLKAEQEKARPIGTPSFAPRAPAMVGAGDPASRPTLPRKSVF